MARTPVTPNDVPKEAESLPPDVVEDEVADEVKRTRSALTDPSQPLAGLDDHAIQALSQTMLSPDEMAKHRAAEETERAALARGPVVSEQTDPPSEVLSEMMTGENVPGDQVRTPEGMERRQVMLPFTLHDNGVDTLYTPTGTNCGLPGFYDLPPEIANHWFAAAHLDNPPPPLPPLPGTAAATDVAMREKTQQRLAEAAHEQEAQQAADAVRVTRAKRVREQLGDAFQPDVTLPPSRQR